jgi:hypothetical protein
MPAFKPRRIGLQLSLQDLVGSRFLNLRNEDTNGIVDDCPRGYAQIATFQSSNSNFLQYRSFNYAHSRILSALQSEIESLETELHNLDRWEMVQDDPEGRLICKENDDLFSEIGQLPHAFRIEFKHTRPQVLALLKSKVVEYGTPLGFGFACIIGAT